MPRLLKLHTVLLNLSRLGAWLQGFSATMDMRRRCTLRANSLTAFERRW
jgi:hypothetical protein